MTLECAECHDHKHDPISQREYYELFAIFNNVPHLGTGYGVHGPLMKYTPPAVGLAKAAPTIEVPVMDELPQPRETHLLVRGDFKNKGERLTAGTPKILPPLKAKGSEPPNRLDFARWLFSADQPLTARVGVNRIWRHHFGEGLVRTVADFGRYGDLPSHPELLDWLAVRFVESGWDVKAMHRLVMSSATYRQASRRRPAAELVDPQNRLLAWFSRVRLPAELGTAHWQLRVSCPRASAGQVCFPCSRPVCTRSGGRTCRATQISIGWTRLARAGFGDRFTPTGNA